MQITITGHQLDVTEALREYINNKFAKLERHFDKITSIRATSTTTAPICRGVCSATLQAAAISTTWPLIR